MIREAAQERLSRGRTCEQESWMSAVALIGQPLCHPGQLQGQNYLVSCAREWLAWSASPYRGWRRRGLRLHMHPSSWSYSMLGSTRLRWAQAFSQRCVQMLDNSWNTHVGQCVNVTTLLSRSCSTLASPRILGRHVLSRDVAELGAVPISTHHAFVCVCQASNAAALESGRGGHQRCYS